MNFFLLRHRPTWTLRLTALLILPMQLITGNQMVYAQATALVQPKPARFVPPPLPIPPPVQPAPMTPEQRTAPKKLSGIAAKISSLHLFAEPLMADGETQPVEDSVLLEALELFASHPSRAGLSALEAFTQTFPHSAWTGSVEADLGFFYRTHGYYTRAVNAWEAAWADLKYSSNPTIHLLADRVVGELLNLLGSLGRVERLEPLLAEIHGRPLYGQALALVRAARESHWLMKHQPGVSFKCGPYALSLLAGN